ncbi:MAG: hypothetical protein CMO81_05580 [Waddliaceae bacterium]|nr:hypothetical protein [Waddliaceae bacterium]|tara:strand:+ start:622 stop:1329 length:708 start_codon:yes stop_codon:yes gene_type:complete
MSIIGIFQTVADYTIIKPVKLAISTTVNSTCKVASFVASLYTRENGIFFALNNDAIAKKAEEYKDFSLREKVIKGCSKGAQGFLISAATIIALHILLSQEDEGEEPSIDITMSRALIAAIKEEVFIRGILQNGVALTQKLISHLSPESWKNNSIAQFCASPASRILVVNSLFASLHLDNAGSYLSTKGALIQSLSIALLPTYSTLHETTGDIIAPLFAHITNNAITGIVTLGARM